MSFEYMFIVDFEQKILYEHPKPSSKDMKRKTKLARNLCIEKCTSPSSTFKQNLSFEQKGGPSGQKYKVTSKKNDNSILVGLLFSSPYPLNQDIENFFDLIFKVVDSLNSSQNKDDYRRCSKDFEDIFNQGNQQKVTDKVSQRLNTISGKVNLMNEKEMKKYEHLIKVEKKSEAIKENAKKGTELSKNVQIEAKNYSDSVTMFVWGLVIVAFLFLVLYLVNFMT